MSVKIREDQHGYPRVAIVPYRYLRELERDAEDYHRLLSRLDVALDRETHESQRSESGTGNRWAGLWKRLLGRNRKEDAGMACRDSEAGTGFPSGNVHKLPVVSRHPWKGSV